MLRFSRMTDYAVVLMIGIAKANGAYLNAATLAEELSLPLPTVSKILKLLLRGGLLNSVRGAKGGYALAKPASFISAGDIIHTIEGAPALAACIVEESCHILDTCPLSANWQKLSLNLQDFLHNISLDVLAKGDSIEVEFSFKVSVKKNLAKEIC